MAHMLTEKATYAILAQPYVTVDKLDDIDWETMLSETGTVEGSAEDLHSYRAELRGILAAIMFTNNICYTASVNKGACTLYGDNKGALCAAFGHKRPTHVGPHTTWYAKSVRLSLSHQSNGTGSISKVTKISTYHFRNWTTMREAMLW
jgi:hypothetical protein